MEIRVQTWCKFGAKTYRMIRKLYHDMRWKRHKITQNERFSTIFRGINASEKTPRDNFDQRSKLAKKVLLCRAFFVISWRTMNCPMGMNWLTPWIAHRVHELPAALNKMGNSIHEIKDFKSWSRKASIHDGLLSIHIQRIQIQEPLIYRARFALIKRAVQFVKNPAVLFTFCRFYGII